MDKLIRFISLVLFFFIASCRAPSSNSGIEQTMEPESEITISPTQASTATLPSTFLPSPTPVITIHVSPKTPISKPEIILQQCIAVDENLPQGINGVILFEKGPNISLLNLDGMKYIEIKPEGLYATVSPDRTKFAYVGYTSTQNDQVDFLILSSNGKILKRLTSQEYWDTIERWLDNEDLSIILGEPMKPGSSDRKYPDAVSVVNIQTDQVQTLQPNFPDIDRTMAENSTPWMPASTTVYNPDLTRVIYPSPKYGVILYGIPERKQLAVIDTYDWLHHPPVWSPDGSKFILMGDDEFYLITYNGKVTKVTNLNQGYEAGNVKNLRYQAQFYSWSPDNHHVAFWLKSLETNKIALAVLDIHDGTIVDYCITPGFDPQRYWVFQKSPVWSPDGKSLVIASNYHPNDKGNEVILMDLEKNMGYKIAENNFPVGWLVSPK